MTIRIIFITILFIFFLSIIHLLLTKVPLLIIAYSLLTDSNFISLKTLQTHLLLTSSDLLSHFICLIILRFRIFLVKMRYFGGSERPILMHYLIFIVLLATVRFLRLQGAGELEKRFF